MGFLKVFRNLFKSPSKDRNYWFYVRCKYCQEVLKGRVDLQSHLSIQYGESDIKNTYYCRKVMIGSNRCYRSIEVEFTFDANRRLIDRQINGGELVTEADFLVARNESEQGKSD